MKIHLSAVGTSLLRNAEDKDPKIKDKLITLGLERWYNLSLDDKKQMVIVQNRSELKNILRNFIRENGDKASAELSSLLKAFKKFNHEPSDTKVFLYYTKSENSRSAGEVIKEYFRDLGYDVELAEVSKINSEENFYEGLTDLFDKVVTKLIKWRNEGHEIFINVTPGFKGESIFLSTAGLMLEATLYYLHESFNDIVVLPSPVCPYTFISIILCSIMIECRDLALNHRWVMGLLRAQRHGAHISVISLTLLGIAHIGVRDHYLSTKICYKQI